MKLPDMNIAKKREKKSNYYIYLKNSNNEKKFCGKKYYIKTYGCQMNVHDSEEIKAILENLGFEETSVMKNSDLIILNTCAIRENAHNKVFGFLGRCKHLKNEKKNLIIGLCGCMAQERSVCDEILNKYSYIDIVFGTHNIHELTDMLYLKSEKLNINVESESNEIIENIPYKHDSKYSAWVNIMYGCDKFCTYCIVPYTRGKQRSRKHEDILKEINDLIKIGYKEVTLLGQNVNAYGKDSDDEISFARLLQMVCDTKIERVRFVTSHPWDFTDEMIDVIKNNDNAMNYIHLPMQSGSSRILKLMGRRYTKNEYIDLYNKIKKAIPNCVITTDIIVGFPGETEDDFLDTLDVVQKCKFDGAYTFIFSKRENTPAALMEDKISPREKEERLERLNKLINNYSKISNEKLVNTTQSVLIIGKSEKDKNKFAGYTEGMKLVNVSGVNINIGDIIPVKIIEAKSFSLDGTYDKRDDN